MQTIVPLPIHSGHHPPITEEGIKTFIGTLIFLSILFLISITIALIKYKKGNYNEMIVKSFTDYNLYQIGFPRLLLHVGVIISWTFLAISVVGRFIAELIFNLK